MYTGCMIREHFTNRTTAPQPLILITGVLWGIALLCVTQGSQPKWAWAMVICASLLTVYAAVRMWIYLAKLHAEKRR